jgi:hypothetical protein
MLRAHLAFHPMRFNSRGLSAPSVRIAMSKSLLIGNWVLEHDDKGRIVSRCAGNGHRGIASSIFCGPGVGRINIIGIPRQARRPLAKQTPM